MKEKVRFLGLDVHAETIAVAIAEPDGEVRSLGTIANREESIRKLVKKLGPVEQLRACYEAGPTGYVLYWQLSSEPNAPIGFESKLLHVRVARIVERVCVGPSQGWSKLLQRREGGEQFVLHRLWQLVILCLELRMEGSGPAHVPIMRHRALCAIEHD